ncbi:MAG: DUF6452 family protein [Bacteroidales bacterium]
MLKNLTVLSIVVSVIMLISCTPQSCMEETIATAKASFYKTGFSSVSAPDSVSLVGIGVDTTFLYEKALKQKTVLFPLDGSRKTCSFVLKINGNPDTLRFYYNSYPHMISKECGLTLFHYIDSVTSSVDTIKLVLINPTASTFNEQNLRIFY